MHRREMALRNTSPGPPTSEQLANLVRNAVGFDAQRGDKVDVVSMRFASRIRADAFKQSG